MIYINKDMGDTISCIIYKVIDIIRYILIGILIYVLIAILIDMLTVVVYKTATRFNVIKIIATTYI